VLADERIWVPEQALKGLFNIRARAVTRGELAEGVGELPARSRAGILRALEELFEDPGRKFHAP
jgi:hypothetical protein